MADVSPPPPSTPVEARRSWWSDFFDAFVAAVVSPETAAWLEQVAEDTSGRLFTVAFAFWFRVQAMIVRQLSRSIDEVDQAAGPQILKMAAEGLSALFGVELAPEALHRRAGITGNGALGEQLGALVLKGLFEITPTSGGPTGEQGLKNAETLVGIGVSLALTGYMNDVGLPPAVHSWLPAFRDLKEVVTHNLGLSRLTRRGLAPVLNAHIVNPLTRYLNSVYRPTLPGAGEAARLYYTAAISDIEYFEIMAKWGYTTELAGQLLAQHALHPSQSQLRQLRELGTITGPDFIAALTAQGYSRESAEALYFLAVNDHVAGYVNDLAKLARDMYAAREITADELAALLEQAGLSAMEQSALLAVASLDRARPKRMSSSDMEAGYLGGFVTIDQLRDFYELEGYAAADVVTLQALAVAKRVKAEAAAELKGPPPAVGAGKPLTQAQVTELFRRGLTSVDQARAELTALGFKGGTLDLAMVDLLAKRNDYVNALAKGQKPAKGATLPKPAAHEAYVRGLTQRSDLEAYYLAVGYPQAATDLLLRLADTDRTAYEARAAAAAAKAAKGTKPPPAA